jgi:arylsulfatase A-like enzyme
MLAAASCSDPGPPPARFPDAPPVILVIIDTLRADHLGFDGYALPTSPVLDALAAQSHCFSANTTQCNATFGSITSILTGLYPKTHRNYTAVPVEGVSSGNAEASTLAERLGERGYHTAAVLSHPSMTRRRPGTAMDRGWDAFSTLPGYVPAEERRHVVGKAVRTTERAFQQLDAWAESAADDPLFLWVHYFDPHTPYDPPEEYRNRFLAHHLAAAGHPEHELALAALAPRGGLRQAYLNEIGDETERKAVRLADARALYDGEILACDEQIGWLFDRLRRDGLFDEALVIVLADHGENLEDEGWGHGAINFSHQRLFEGVTRTPMLIKLPGQAEGVESGSLTQNIDILPTVIELLGLDAEPEPEGRSLVPLLDDPRGRVHERVFTESSDHVEKALRTDTLKYMDGLEPEPLVFAWADDPNETRDIAHQLPGATLAGLSAAMDAFRPLNVLGVRFVPDAAPYEVDVEVSLGAARIESVVGVEASSDSRHVAYHVAVDDEPVEVLLLLDRPMRRSTWSVSRTGGAEFPEAIHLGRTPLTGTAAVPLWRVDDEVSGRAPGKAIRLQRDDAAGRWSLQLGAGVKQDVVVELQFSELSPAALELVDGLGFNLLSAGSGERVARLVGSVATGAESATIAWPPERGPLLATVLLDDRWPDASRIRWNGQPVSRRSFGFVLPRDDRITVKLLGARDDWPEPPGAIIVYTTAASDQVELDTSGLDSAAIEELRALGYVK